MIQSNAFESNASADESNENASANASITGQSNASANAAFAFALANAFEHKPGSDARRLRLVKDADTALDFLNDHVLRLTEYVL